MSGGCEWKKGGQLTLKVEKLIWKTQSSEAIVLILLTFAEVASASLSFCQVRVGWSQGAGVVRASCREPVEPR